MELPLFAKLFQFNWNHQSDIRPPSRHTKSPIRPLPGFWERNAALLARTQTFIELVTGINN
jgi:hypothetical protein